MTLPCGSVITKKIDHRKGPRVLGSTWRAFWIWPVGVAQENKVLAKPYREGIV